MGDDPDRRPLVTPDPWARLRAHTAARIGQGRVGSSQPLADSLAFKLAHAQARDAVWTPLDVDALVAALAAEGVETVRLHSEAADRMQYLTRPDLGRRLDGASVARLAEVPGGLDLAIVVADGLSSRAVQAHAAPFLASFLPLARGAGLRLGSVGIVEQGRVAVGDAVAQALDATLVAVLIGERPGLSSPDSMGVYLTHTARPGTTDEARNCISNVRPEGLPIPEGVRKLAWLVQEALGLGFTGVRLKDRMDGAYLPFSGPLRGLRG